MKVTIKNVSNGPRGFHAAAGVVFLDPGQSATDVEVADGEIASAKASGYFDVKGGTAKVEKQASTGGYAVREKSAGWFVVTKDGADATKSLRKDNLEGFEAKSDEEKAAFVEANKVEG